MAIIDEHPGEVEEESPIAHANPTIDQNGEEIEAIKAMSGCLAQMSNRYEQMGSALSQKLENLESHSK